LGLGVTRSYLDQQAPTIEKVVAALTESLVFTQIPANKPVVLKSMMKNLRLNDLHAAEEGYQDLLVTLNRKPYPSLDGLRNAQRLMTDKIQKLPTSRSKNWQMRGLSENLMTAVLSIGCMAVSSSKAKVRFPGRVWL
jgi:hypothetical protein